MDQKNKSITISEEAQIDRPPSRQFIPIDKTDLQRIKKIVGQINDKYSRWENAAWASLSLSLGLFTASLNIVDKITSIIFLTSSISFLVISILLFIFSNYISKSLAKSKEDVLDEIEAIEKKFKASIIETSEESGLRIISAKYGADGKFMDITDKLNSMVENNVLKTSASNEIAGDDPIKGTEKELQIEYKYIDQVYKKVIPENQEFTIPESEFIEL